MRSSQTRNPTLVSSQVSDFCGRPVHTVHIGLYVVIAPLLTCLGNEPFHFASFELRRICRHRTGFNLFPFTGWGMEKATPGKNISQFVSHARNRVFRRSSYNTQPFFGFAGRRSKQILANLNIH